MSTFLQMVNLVRQDAGITGGDLTTLQSGLSAESTRIKSWVNREWRAVQRLKPDWQWMRASGTLVLTASQPSYTVTQCGAASTPVFTAAQFANWKRDSFRVTATSQNYADEMLATFMPWDQYRNVYQYGPMRTNFNRPVAFTVAPDKSLWFGNGPDTTGWTVVYEMYTAPVDLVLDADVPACPSFYHDLIVYRALESYGMFMSADEVLGYARQKIAEIKPLVMADQLPIITTGPPLA